MVRSGPAREFQAGPGPPTPRAAEDRRGTASALVRPWVPGSVDCAAALAVRVWFALLQSGFARHATGIAPVQSVSAISLNLDTGQESIGQERQPRRRPLKARLSSGLVQSRLLSCPRRRSEASGQTVHVSRQVNDLPKHVIDPAGGGRKGLRGSRTTSRPESICGKSASTGSVVSV